MGHNPFGESFREVEGNPINGRKLVVKQFDRDASLDELQECQLLYISSTLVSETPEIIATLGTNPVLTVGESSKFIDIGGMISFVIHNDRVRFEINNSAAEQSGINIRSKLLRVSIRVIMNNHSNLIFDMQGQPVTL
jgi:hypothetical protein